MKGPAVNTSEAIRPFATSPVRARRQRWAISAVLVASALALAGCAGTAASTETPAAQNQTQDQRPGGGGVSGLIAASSDDVLQVQSDSEQTAVSYTADTAVTSQVAGALSDVTVGSCVVAMTGSDASAASSIIVTEAVDGECTGGFGGGGGQPGGQGAGGSGTPPTDIPFPTSTDAPSDAPTDAPTDGGPGSGQGFGAIASGLVTAVSGSTVTVDARTMGSDDTTSTDVTVDSATTFTKTVDADASALVVGQCVSAQGAADTSGGFAATSLQVSAPVDGSCVQRFGGGPRS